MSFSSYGCFTSKRVLRAFDIGGSETKNIVPPDLLYLETLTNMNGHEKQQGI